MPKTTTKKTAKQVAERLAEQLAENPDLIPSFMAHVASRLEASIEERRSLDAWLDERAGEDAWGTEGQNDPRGDRRDEG